jgi:hypothetical protein
MALKSVEHIIQREGTRGDETRGAGAPASPPEERA